MALDMTEENALERQTTTSTPMAVRNEISEIWEQASEEIAEAKKNFENQRPPCPKDGTPSRFFEYRGAYTRVRGVFRCEKGHEFYLG